MLLYRSTFSVQRSKCTVRTVGPDLQQVGANWSSSDGHAPHDRTRPSVAKRRVPVQSGHKPSRASCFTPHVSLPTRRFRFAPSRFCISHSIMQARSSAWRTSNSTSEPLRPRTVSVFACSLSLSLLFLFDLLDFGYRLQYCQPERYTVYGTEIAGRVGSGRERHSSARAARACASTMTSVNAVTGPRSSSRLHDKDGERKVGK